MVFRRDNCALFIQTFANSSWDSLPRYGFRTLQAPEELLALLQELHPAVLVSETAVDSAIGDPPMTQDFRWRHFRGEIVPRAVRWHCRYGISYRDLKEMLEERGVAVDHTAIHRRVQAYAKEIERRLRWHCRRDGRSPSWRVDETYVKVKGKRACPYRLVDSRGDTVDFHLSQTRNAGAAKRFPGKALRGCKVREKPCVTNTDKAGCYGRAIRELKKEGECPSETDHRQVKYPNSVAEADHGRLKLLIKPTLGFRSMKAAYATIKGFKAMHALRKKQASAFQLQPGIRGEVRLVERAFGIGPEMMVELMQLLGAELEQIAIQQGIWEKA